MGILSYIAEKKAKFRAEQEQKARLQTVATAKELKALRDKRIALEGRQKVADLKTREEAKVKALEAQQKQRNRENSPIGKAANFLKGTRDELRALKSENNPWRENLVGAKQLKKKKQEDFNPWR